MLPIALLIVVVFIIVIPVLFGMAETIPQDKVQNEIVVTGFKDLVNRFSDILETNGVDMHAGLFITREGETSPDIDLIADGEVPYGIILDYSNIRDYPAAYTLGQTFPDNSTVKVLRRASNITVQCILFRSASSSLAVALGDPAYVVDGASWDIGEVSTLKAGAVTQRAPGTPEQAMRLFVGRFAKAHAAGTATNLVTLVTLGEG